MKRGLPIQDRDLARRRAQAAEREQEQCKPVEDVECACGCGWWPEKDMMYWVIADKYFRYQACANKYWRKDI